MFDLHAFVADCVVYKLDDVELSDFEVDEIGTMRVFVRVHNAFRDGSLDKWVDYETEINIECVDERAIIISTYISVEARSKHPDDVYDLEEIIAHENAHGSEGLFEIGSVDDMLLLRMWRRIEFLDDFDFMRERFSRILRNFCVKRADLEYDINAPYMGLRSFPLTHKRHH